jgi:hypothetical protein
MVAPTCLGLTLPSSGSVPSAFWEMFNRGAVDRILWMGVLCLVTWCARPRLIEHTERKCTVWGLKNSSILYLGFQTAQGTSWSTKELAGILTNTLHVEFPNSEGVSILSTKFHTIRVGNLKYSGLAQPFIQQLWQREAPVPTDRTVNSGFYCEF